MECRNIFCWENKEAIKYNNRYKVTLFNKKKYIEMRIRMIYLSVMLACLSVMGVSCSTQRGNLVYFTNIDSIAAQAINNEDYRVRLLPDDELKIVVTSQEPSATAPYNLPLANYAAVSALSGNTSPSIQTYIVDKDGNVTMPILGKVHVAGKTTQEVAEHIKNLIAKDVKDPYVTVKMFSYRVNILGEVHSPGAKTVSREIYTIVDAIADAGDLTNYGQRENILLIREENGKRIHVRLNLNDARITESPYYYLKQNDIIYVEPNKIRISNTKYNQDNGFKLSVISTIVSACSVVASLIIALVAK